MPNIESGARWREPTNKYEPLSKEEKEQNLNDKISYIARQLSQTHPEYFTRQILAGIKKGKERIGLLDVNGEPVKEGNRHVIVTYDGYTVGITSEPIRGGWVDTSLYDLKQSKGESEE